MNERISRYEHFPHTTSALSCTVPNDSSLKSTGLDAKGFTLVELAVVLVILGAIFMSVLKVDSMIKNAKIRQVIGQYRELRTAILVYKDKYGYLPGDDPYAVAHVGATHANAVSTGGGDGRIIYQDPVTMGYKYEQNYLWEHLGKAGLIKGNYDGNYSAFNRIFAATPMLHVFSTSSPSHSIIVLYDSAINSNRIQFFNLPYDVAQAFDVAFDDGVYNAGNVRSGRDYTTEATKDPISNSYGNFPVGSAYWTSISFN